MRSDVRRRSRRASSMNSASAGFALTPQRTYFPVLSRTHANFQYVQAPSTSRNGEFASGTLAADIAAGHHGIDEIRRPQALTQRLFDEQRERRVRLDPAEDLLLRGVPERRELPVRPGAVDLAQRRVRPRHDGGFEIGIDRQA